MGHKARIAVYYEMVAITIAPQPLSKAFIMPGLQAMHPVFG